MKERILITVRTYPTISAKHIETVCTGGITDAGEWRRLYPVPLRYLEGSKQFKTFDIVEVDVQPATDGRPESRRPQMPSLKITGHVDAWQARCDWVNRTTFASMAAMLADGRTIGPVAVREVLEFIAKPSDADWSPAQRALLQQELMFDKRLPLEKIPFDFRIRWRDGDGREHESLVLAWEIYQTWRQYRGKYADPVDIMRQKWMEDILGPAHEVSFFMGNHSRFRENWMICGWFTPPKEIAKDATLF